MKENVCVEPGFFVQQEDGKFIKAFYKRGETELSLTDFAVLEADALMWSAKIAINDEVVGECFYDSEDEEDDYALYEIYDEEGEKKFNGIGEFEDVKLTRLGNIIYEMTVYKKIGCI